MIKKVGRDYKIYVVTGGTTYTAIGGELNSSLTVNNEVIDMSDKDSDWAENLAGQKSWEVSGSFILDQTASAEQQDMFTALVADTLVTIFIGQLSGQTVTSGHSGTAIVASIAESYDKGGACTKDISFTGTGALSLLPVATTTTTTAA